jgi:hypothetical protein
MDSNDDFVIILDLIKYIVIPYLDETDLKLILEFQNSNQIYQAEQLGINIHECHDYALQWASQNGHLEVVKLLIEKGANVHENNERALKWSAMNGHFEVVKLLIENGANIRINNDIVLLSASNNGHHKITKLLIENGANPRFGNGRWTPSGEPKWTS